MNVNDVVEVTENNYQQETSQRHPVLVQVRLGHTFFLAHFQKGNDNEQPASRGQNEQQTDRDPLSHNTPVLVLQRYIHAARVREYTCFPSPYTGAVGVVHSSSFV